MIWPTQAECDQFYGNPRGPNSTVNHQWYDRNIMPVTPPYQMTYDGHPVVSIRIHRLCVEALRHALNFIWTESGKDQKVVDDWGASIYGGAFNYRLKRQGGGLSMHAYGCAIDLDPARNGQGTAKGRFEAGGVVNRAFTETGAVWGGLWAGRSRDPMHWQWARLK